ncbi:Epimerase family protein [bacterium HR19]|nr:Epimerase family protein [bacterium HR19]
MIFIISGGTGSIGSYLIKRISKPENTLIMLTRKQSKKENNRIFLNWNDLPEITKIVNELKKDEKITLINLAGENIGQRWTKKTKEKIIKSRVESTEKMVELAKNLSADLFISASAVGYYGDTGEKEVEESHPKGNIFLSDVCDMWEKSAKKAGEYGIKTAIARIGVVISKEAKFIKYQLPPIIPIVANPFGKGENYISWVHIEDVINCFEFIASEREKFFGEGENLIIFNLCSPKPAKAKEIVKELSQHTGRKFILPVPDFLLSVAMGSDFVKETIKISQRVVPKFLISKNFEFKYQEIKSAIQETLEK